MPLQDPDSGPNFAEFGAKTKHGKNGKPQGEDVLYEIHIVNDESGKPSITYQFRFTTTILHSSFLYNTGPIKVHDGNNFSDTWNRPQSYTVHRIEHRKGHTKTDAVASSPRRALQQPAVQRRCPLNAGLPQACQGWDLRGPPITSRSSAGQRADGFFVDLGAIFDLGDLRPLSPDQAFPPHKAPLGNQLPRGQERALDRAADSDSPADPRRQSRQGRTRGQGCDRRLHDGEPAKGADV